MKILIVGDIHGRKEWEEIHPNLYDKIIFLGDYVDSFEFTDYDILRNFQNIINFAKTYPDKVILLIGNHDDHYLYNFSKGSGYRPSYAGVMKQLLVNNIDLFKVAHLEGNCLFTHAGITNGWYAKHYLQTIPGMMPDFNIAQGLNHIYFDTKDAWRLSIVGPVRGGDIYNIPGPLWADKSELCKDPISGYNQFVGHTRVKSITKITTNDAELLFCDVLENLKEPVFHEISMPDKAT